MSVPELVESLQEGDRVALGDGGVALIAEERDGSSMKVQGHGRRQGPGSPRGYRPGLQAFAQDSDAGRPGAPRGPAGRGYRERRCFLRAHCPRPGDGAGAHREGAFWYAPRWRPPRLFEDIDNILQVADTLMVARGDLGVRVALEEVPHIQKQLIRVLGRLGPAGYHRHPDARVHDQFACAYHGRR